MNNASDNGYNKVVAWIIVIILIIAVAHTRIGYKILYMFVIASIILVVLVSYPTIQNIFGTATKSKGS